MSLPEKYTQEEMELVLQRALSQKSQSGDISREQLIEVGKELGLTEQDLERAAADELHYGGLEEARDEVLEKKKQGWKEHLLWYVGANSITMGLNFMQEDGRFTWALFILLGWGVGMASHTISTFFPDKKKLDKAARKLLRKQNRSRELGE